MKKVDLEAFISSGLVTVMSINSETELQTYIDLASELDDGEAITISLAIHNGCLIATDDRKALRLISNIGSLTAVSTLELIKAWSEAKDINDAEVKQVLLNMYLCASYRPSERDPLYKWWQTMTKK